MKSKKIGERNEMMGGEGDERVEASRDGRSRWASALLSELGGR
jgi:hypothetical protein